jgi:hypothetical protein
MILRHTLLLGAALGTLGHLAAAQSAAASSPARPAPVEAPRAPAVHPGGIARASALIGCKVVDGTDNAAGEIRDFIACNTGDLVVLVERRGDAKLVAVPLSALDARFDGSDKRTVGDTIKVDTFAIGAGFGLADAPQVADRTQLDPAWWTAFGEHFGRTTMAQAGAATVHDPAVRDAVCLGTYTGQAVRTVAGENLGSVKDVAVDLANGKLAYVVISIGGTMGMGATLHGVRIDSLQPDAMHTFVTLNTDKATLDRTTGIDIDKLPAKPSFEVSMAAPGGAGRSEPASPPRR